MQIPSSYQPGYEKALLTDPDLAKTYIQHTLIGDPDADALINGLAGIDEKQQGEFIRAGMDLDEEKLRDAPQAVRAFFEKVGTPPAWFVPSQYIPDAVASKPIQICFLPRLSWILLYRVSLH